MLAQRNSISSVTIELLSARISQRLFELQEFNSAATISTYLNTKSEVSTDQLIAWCISHGKRVIVPVMNRAKKTINLLRN